MAFTLAVARPVVVSPEATALYFFAPLALNCTVKGTPAGTERYFLSVNLAVTFEVTLTVRPFLTGSGLALVRLTFLVPVAVGPTAGWEVVIPGGAQASPRSTRLVAPRT